MNAPSSIAPAPRQVRWSVMRESSPTITRMYCARSGICSVDAEQLLDRQRVADVVEHRRDVVQPIGVREDLRLGRVLRLLLEAAVQVADLDVGAATIVSPSTSSTMRTVPCIAGCDGPMLSGIGSVGSSGLVEVLGVLRRRGPRGGSRAGRASGPVGLGDARRSITRRGRRSRADQRLALLLGVVLAQRVPDELGVHEDAAQVGVALEARRRTGRRPRARTSRRRPTPGPGVVDGGIVLGHAAR